MTQQELELPKGWILSSIKTICKNHDHQRIPISAKKRKQIQGKIPYYGASGIIDYVEKPIFSGKYFLIGEDGANLISRSSPIGFIVEGDFWVNNHAHILSTYGNIPLEFLSYYIASISLRPWISGSAQPKLNQENLKKIPISLPPLNEQKRIVSKIEELFSKIDSTKQSLEHTKLQLKNYRISFLKSIFEVNPSQLSEGWAYVKLEDIVKKEKYAIKRGPFGSHLKKEFFVKSGYKIYEQQHAINNDFTLGKYYINEEKFQELKGFEVKSGDIIISCSGTIGKLAVVPETFQPGIINQALLKISIDDTIMNIEIFKYLFEFWMLKAEVETHGSGMGNLSSVKALKEIPILLAPKDEQKGMISQIEQGFSLIENSQRIVNSTLQTLETMRMSVLKQAFEGKLVTQDPNDEPASILLEKICNKTGS